jgi:hypothetical protein
VRLGHMFGLPDCLTVVTMLLLQTVQNKNPTAACESF